MGRQVGRKLFLFVSDFQFPKWVVWEWPMPQHVYMFVGKYCSNKPTYQYISYYCIYMCYYISIIPRYIPIIYNSPYLKYLMCAGRCLWSHHDGEQKVGREAAGLGRTGWVVSWHWQWWKVYFFPRNTHQDFSYTNAGKPCKARNCNKISVSLTRPGIEKSCATFKIVNVNRKHMVEGMKNWHKDTLPGTSCYLVAALVTSCKVKNRPWVLESLSPRHCVSWNKHKLFVKNGGEQVRVATGDRCLPCSLVVTQSFTDGWQETVQPSVKVE